MNEYEGGFFLSPPTGVYILGWGRVGREVGAPHSSGTYNYVYWMDVFYSTKMQFCLTAGLFLRDSSHQLAHKSLAETNLAVFLRKLTLPLSTHRQKVTK